MSSTHPTPESVPTLSNLRVEVSLREQPDGTAEGTMRVWLGDELSLEVQARLTSVELVQASGTLSNVLRLFVAAEQHAMLQAQS